MQKSAKTFLPQNLHGIWYYYLCVQLEYSEALLIMSPWWHLQWPKLCSYCFTTVMLLASTECTAMYHYETPGNVIIVSTDVVKTHKTQPVMMLTNQLSFQTLNLSQHNYRKILLVKKNFNDCINRVYTKLKQHRNLSIQYLYTLRSYACMC